MLTITDYDASNGDALAILCASAATFVVNDSTTTARLASAGIIVADAPAPPTSGGSFARLFGNYVGVGLVACGVPISSTDEARL